MWTELISAADLRWLFVGTWLAVLVCLGLGLAAWVSHRRCQDPSDLAVLFNPDTAEFPRAHVAQHRHQSRTVRHRQPVCRRRVPTSQRPTVQVQVYDPPEGRRG